MPFIINENENIDESVVGTWNDSFNDLNILQNIANKIRFKEYTLNSIGNISKSNKISVSSLSDDLIAFCYGEKIILMNNSFEEIKSIERINNESFSPSHIISSENSEKYFIIDSKKIGNFRECVNRLFTTDLEFQLIKIRHLNECLEVKSLISYKSSIFLIDTGD
jgi:hypothetical protein